METDAFRFMLPSRASMLIAVIFALSACASVPEKGGFDEVQAAVSERVGQRVEWYQSDPEDTAVADALWEMLDGELSVDEAVQVALLNNRRLQATYEDLGLAQANLVQAGLLSNPIFSGGIFFPAGDNDTRIELNIVQSFLSVLYRPLRKRVAAAEFEATKLSVTEAVLALATDTRATFHMIQAAGQREELLHQIVASTGAAYEASKRLLDAGNVISLDVDRERALYENARLFLATAEVDLVVDSEKLNRLMGLWGEQATWRIDTRLPDLPADRFNLEHLEQRAIEANLHLAIYRHRIEAIAVQLGLIDKTALIPELNIGVGSEREGNWEVGPTLDLQIPIFDQGQARRAAARSELRRAQQIYWAYGVDLRSATRALHQRMLTARRRAEHVQDTVLPLSNQIVQDTQLQYNGMQLGVFQLLQAKEDEIAAGLQYIETLRDYWLVRTGMDQLLNGYLGGDFVTLRWGGSDMINMNTRIEER